MQPEYSILRLGVGILVGMTGVAGALVTPVLALFGVTPIVAVGTDLAFAAITKSFGAVVHKRQSSVEWRVARLLAVGSYPAAVLAIAFLPVIDISEDRTTITRALSVARWC